MNTPVEPQIAEPQMNATPLIDVLLVLLVMIVLTLPVASHAVKLNMPQGTSLLPPVVRPVIAVHIDYDGQLYWNGEALPDQQALDSKFREVGGRAIAPRVKVLPDKRVRYENVAQVLAAAQRARVSLLEVAPIF
jgi:biopolymer transport protein ExbD